MAGHGPPPQEKRRRQVPEVLERVEDPLLRRQRSHVSGSPSFRSTAPASASSVRTWTSWSLIGSP